MFPFGHLAVGYLAYSLCSRRHYDTPPAAGPVVVVLFASLVPDLVDKPLAWSLGVLPSGRSFGHSLLVLVPLSIAGYLLAKRDDRTEYAVAVAVGAIAHSLVDGTPLLWDPYTSEQFLFCPLVPVTVPPVLEAVRPPLGLAYALADLLLPLPAAVCWWRDGCPGLEPIRAVLGRDSRTSK